MVKTIKELLQAVADGEMPPQEAPLREAVYRLGWRASMQIDISRARKPGPCFQDGRHEIKSGDLCVRDRREVFVGNRYCGQCGARLLLELGAGDRPPFQFVGSGEAGNLVDAD